MVFRRLLSAKHMNAVFGMARGDDAAYHIEGLLCRHPLTGILIRHPNGGDVIAISGQPDAGVDHTGKVDGFRSLTNHGHLVERVDSATIQIAPPRQRALMGYAHGTGDARGNQECA